MSNFCKNEDCPSSERLLAFQNGDIELSEGRSIRAHLSICEFCEAEVDFYEHYPPLDEKVEPVEMPQPLLQLAEAILGKRRDSSFAELKREIDRLDDTEY